MRRNVNARGVRSRLLSLFPTTHITQVSLSDAHSRRTCSHLLDSFTRKGAGILIKARVIAGNLSFSGISIINVLSTSALLRRPGFHTCRATCGVVSRIDKQTNEGNRRNEIVLRAGRPRLDIVRRVIRGSCPTFCTSAVTRQRRFGCPPFSRVVGVRLHRGGTRVIAITTRRVTTRLHRELTAEILKPSGPTITEIGRLRVEVVVLGVRTAVPLSTIHPILITTQSALTTAPHATDIVILFSISPL